MLVYLLAVAVILVAALLAFGLAAFLHLSGMTAVLFIVLLLVVGIATAVVLLVLHFRAKKKAGTEGDAPTAGATGELDLLLNDANRKLRDSQQGAKKLDGLPLLYLLGESGSAKTTLVQQSGLDPELVAGTAPREGESVATPVVNLWFTKLAVLLEVGASVRQSNALLTRLVERTRSKAYRSAFGTGAAARAAIVCVSAEQLLTPDGGTSLMASARSIGVQLREISRLLGTTLPVFVIVTKIDRVPWFEQYVRNLTNVEIRQILGSPLPRTSVSAGVYADEATRVLGDALDGIAYKLGEFRVEMLDRETDPRNTAGVYEFPREFGKIRKLLNQYAVELCKPSHLSANPYLRGIFFTGIRAQVVEKMANAPVAEERPLQNAGATQFLNISMGKLGANAPSNQPVMVQSRVPQWTFLARLLPEFVLGDKSALSATSQTAPARLFRRILFATLALCLLTYVILLTISFFHNRAVERDIQDVSVALPASSGPAGLPELRNLDKLRAIIVEMDGFNNRGISHLSYRWGLYRGEELQEEATRLYFDRFRPLMLKPAQDGFLGYLRPLPETPQANDFSLYTTAYEPLKAYLITTSHPEKSDLAFLTPVFLRYWTGSRQVDSDQQQLAQKQIDFYANELLRKPPYSIAPDTLAVAHAQLYLNNFRGENRIYAAMLNDADKAGETINFNKRYPNPCVSDGYVIRGAFTKNGFGFMQTALTNPAKYAGGEPWVLGTQQGPAQDLATVATDLKALYPNDYKAEWHKFMTSAQVGNCGGLHEASSRLNLLAGPSSPLLALFFTVSHNTAVADPQISKTFQPTQALVDPNARDRYTGGNAIYIGELTKLSTAIDQVASAPPSTDPMAFQPIQSEIPMAKNAVAQTAQTFNIDDPQFKTGAISQSLLMAPIECAVRLVPSPGAAANGAGANLCRAVNGLLGKFPFAPKSSTQASVAEVNQIFMPETGLAWSILGGPLKGYLVPQGSSYVAAPMPPQPVNPRFAAYFSHIAKISSAFYAPGSKSPTLKFTLKFLPSSGITSATIVTDNQRIPSGATRNDFTWDGTTAQKASLIYDGTETPLDFSGPWAVFQLVRAAQITKTGESYRLDYPINTSTTIAGRTVSQSGATTKTVSFELSGPGSGVLVGDEFSGLVCAPVVKAQ